MLLLSLLLVLELSLAAKNFTLEWQVCEYAYDTYRKPFLLQLCTLNSCIERRIRGEELLGEPSQAVIDYSSLKDAIHMVILKPIVEETLCFYRMKMVQQSYTKLLIEGGQITIKPRCLPEDNENQYHCFEVYKVPYQCRILENRRSGSCSWTRSGVSAKAYENMAQCRDECLDSRYCLSGFEWKSGDCIHITQLECNFWDTRLYKGGDEWTIVPRNCEPEPVTLNLGYQHGIDYLPKCEYKGDHNYCDPPQAQCRADTCVAPGCKFKGTDSIGEPKSGVDCMMPSPPKKFYYDQCEAAFREHIQPRIDDTSGLPLCHRLEGWINCQISTERKYPDRHTVKVASGVKKGMIRMVKGLFGMIPVAGSLITASLDAYATVRGCETFACTTKACDTNCFLEKSKAYVDAAVDFRINKLKDDLYETAVRKAEALLQKFNNLPQSDKLGCRGQRMVDSMDNIMITIAVNWHKEMEASEKGLLLFMRFASIHILFKFMLLDFYSNESTRRDVMERLQKYIRYAENQVNNFVERRIEEGVILMVRNEYGFFSKIPPKILVKDRQCDTMRAEIPYGYIGAMNVYECVDDYFKTYAIAMGRFCEFEYRKAVEQDQWTFWNREVMDTVGVWEEMVKSLESASLRAGPMVTEVCEIKPSNSKSFKLDVESDHSVTDEALEKPSFVRKGSLGDEMVRARPIGDDVTDEALEKPSLVRKGSLGDEMVRARPIGDDDVDDEHVASMQGSNATWSRNFIVLFSLIFFVGFIWYVSNSKRTSEIHTPLI